MKFEVEEIENDVDIPIVNEIVRFAVKDSSVIRAQFITIEDGVMTTVEEVDVEGTGIRDVKFFNGAFIDGSRAKNARIRLIYTGDKFPELMFEVGSAITHDDCITYDGDHIIFNYKLCAE
jgi:hypothetical protein